MIIVGICGRSGSGKSTFCKILSELNYAYIDCDKVSKEVTTKGSPCLLELSSHFGSDILFEDGTLNRSKLASIAFSNKDKTVLLNSITHKYITESVEEKIKNLKIRGEKFVFIDAPTLFESGMNEKCDIIISVIANEDKLVSRIVSRDDKAPSDAQNRLSMQHNNEFLIKNSDICIYNNETLAHLEETTKSVLKALEEKYGN